MGVQGIWAVLKDVPDPEIPAVSVIDLGIVRSVDEEKVVITPTYSGCPATQFIEEGIRAALDAAGYRAVGIETRLAPAWTTDWMTDEGRAKLQAHGIAPPQSTGRHERRPNGPVLVQLGPPRLTCPQCGSTDTEELTRFGSTSCKSMWRCLGCREPFDHFRAH